MGVSGNAVTAPDGTQTAELLALPAVTGTNAYSTIGQTPASQPASAQTFSLWLRGNLGTEVVWLMSTADAITYQRTQCTLTSGWKRYSVQTGSATGYRVSVGIDLRDGSQSSKPVQNIYAWGGQLEDGVVMSSTMINGYGTTFTRAADSLTIPAPASVAPTPAPMTLYVKAIDQGISAQADATGKVVASVGAGNNRFTISHTSTPDLSLDYRTASVDHKASDTTSLPAFGDTVEYRATLAGNGATGLSHSTNAGLETTPVGLSGGTTLASDTFTRANSSSTLGTATTGGAWTARTGTWGINNNKAYTVTATTGNEATLTCASQPDTISLDFATANIQTTAFTPIARWVDANNVLRLGIAGNAGKVSIVTTVAGVGNTRASSGVILPTTGAASGTLSMTILSNVVTAYLNGVQACQYTLSGGEVTAFGSSVIVGIEQRGTGSGNTADNFSAISGATAVALPAAWDSSTIEIASLAGAQQGGLAIVGLVVVAGAVALVRARGASKKPIGPGADTTPASIVLTPAVLTMTQGGSDVNFTATVTNAAGSTLVGAAVTYTSDTTNVCTVGSSSGIAHAVNTGQAIITATTTNGITDTTTVTVTADTVPANATISPTSAVMTVGSADVTFTGAATNAAGAALPGASFTYTSSTPAVATIVASTGVCHAVASGGTTITATTGNGKTATASVTVSTNTTPAAIAVSPTSMSLSVGGPDGQITPTVTNSGGGVISGATVTYVSGTPSVATVTSGGLVHAVAVGSSVVTATDSAAHTATCTVTVSASTTPTSIVVSPSTLTLSLGSADLQMTATVTGSSGVISGSPVSWTSSTTGVATVGINSGLVHAVAAGTATITGTTSNGLTATATCTCSSSGARTLLFPHARFRYIIREPSRSNTTDRAWYNSHISDIEDTSSNGTLAGHPNAISVASYLLLTRMEVDGGAVFTSDGLGGGSWSAPYNDASNPSGACTTYSANYATANGLNVEDFWLHSRTGDLNRVAGVWSISPAGVVLFNSPSRVGLCSSFPYTAGQTITLAGLSTGNGTYTIASLQQRGVTLTGWSAGQLGPTSAPSSISTTKIGTLSIIGDGTKTFANRLWNFYFSEWRNVPYFGNTGCRQMHSARVALVVANNGNPFNAVFFDETDSSQYNTANVTSVEYGTTGGTTFGSVTVCQFATDMGQCMTDMKAYPGGPKYIRANTSTLTFANDIVIARAAGGIHGEQLCNRFDYGTTALDFYIARVNEGVDVEFVDGGVWLLAQNNGGVTPSPGVWLEHSGTIAGNYPSTSVKGQMSSYVYYLLGVDARQTNPDGTTYKHAIFDLCNSNNPGDIPASARWQLAYEYDVGQPVGAKVKTSLTDPAALPTQTHTRTFSRDGGATLSAWVGYVSTVNGQTNYGTTSQMTMTPPTLPSGSAWFLLNGDGSFGTQAVTSVVVARSEGVILVALPSGTLAKRSDAFVDSIGTNIHMDATPYTSLFSTSVIPAMLDTGIRTVRSGAFGSGADAPIALTNALLDACGSQLILVSNPGSSYSDMSVQDYMVSKIDPSKVFAFEGPNEVDNNNSSWGGIGTGGPTGGGYGQNVTTFMAAMKAWRDAHANPLVRAILLGTPTVTSAYGASKGADWSSYATLGTLHPYPGAVEPGAPLAQAMTDVKPIMASLGRFMATETGYETAPNATSPSYLIGTGVSTTAQNKYLPRLFAEYFNQGIERSAFYELYDDGTDLTNGENNFGMYKSDGTAKPVATTIKNLIAILKERTYVPPSSVAGTAYVTDTFTRANASGWGTATSGSDSGSLTWISGDAAESSQFAIVSNRGKVVQTSQVRNSIGASHSGDSEVYVEYRNIRANYSNLMRTYIRYTAYNQAYSFDVNPGVSNQVSLNKNASTSLAAQTVSAVAGWTDISVRVRVRTIGSDVYLYGKVWQYGTAEPSAWTLTAVDSAPASSYLAGNVCVWVDNNSSGGNITLSAFTWTPVTVTAGSMPALSAITLGRLSYTLTGSTTNVQTLLLQKGDGSFWLLLWQRVSSWNAGTKTNITNAAVTVSIGFPQSHTLTQYTPSAGTGGTILGTATAATFQVPDEILILKIQ